MQQLVVSWQRYLKLFNWRPLECRKYTNSLAVEALATSRILHGDGKVGLNTKVNQMARMGLVIVDCGRWYLRVT